LVSTVHVLGISGSLRKFSYNAGLLRAASELLPEGMTLEVFDLAPIPLFNQDLTDSGNIPEPVQQFKALIATPEYNYSMPGVLKNAIDWASRPVQGSPLDGKPLAMMGAGGGMGTSRAQYHLRQIAVFTNLLPLNKPKVTVQRAFEKFDAQGHLTDEPTRRQVRALL